MRSVKEALTKIIIVLSVLLFLVFLLFPFYWMFVTSLKPNEELFTGVVTYWPENPTFQAYIKLFQSYDFLGPMKNSFIVASITTVVSLVVAVLAAFAFARYEFPGRKYIMMMFLTNNMFPTVLLLMLLHSLSPAISPNILGHRWAKPAMSSFPTVNIRKPLLSGLHILPLVKDSIFGTPRLARSPLQLP